MIHQALNTKKKKRDCTLVPWKSRILHCIGMQKSELLKEQESKHAWQSGPLIVIRGCYQSRFYWEILQIQSVTVDLVKSTFHTLTFLDSISDTLKVWSQDLSDVFLVCWSLNLVTLYHERQLTILFPALWGTVSPSDWNWQQIPKLNILWYFYLEAVAVWCPSPCLHSVTSEMEKMPIWRGLNTSSSIICLAK